MRIAILSDTYPKNMGYAGTLLPKALAQLGAEVHLVTAGIHPYSNMPKFEETYGDFSFKPDSGMSTEFIDGYTVHFLQYKEQLGYVRMLGLYRKLKELRPDIVQTFSTLSWTPLMAAIMRLPLGYKFYTGNHTTASVFPLAQRKSDRWERERIKNLIVREAPGKLISLFAEKCYAATIDCAEVAVQYFGVPKKKIEICPLGVDTDIFSFVPRDNDDYVRNELRRKLGFTSTDIICIYTGRFSSDKNPLILAKAIESLASEGECFKGIFIGNGEQAKELSACVNCVVLPFVPFYELAKYYQASDIGVWPTQESTSMLDAAACGLPVVVNDTLKAVERIEGNGLKYKLNDIEELTQVLRCLKDKDLRLQLGTVGAAKIVDRFSWKALAQQRLSDYLSAVSGAK